MADATTDTGPAIQSLTGGGAPDLDSILKQMSQPQGSPTSSDGSLDALRTGRRQSMQSEVDVAKQAAAAPSP